MPLDTAPHSPSTEEMKTLREMVQGIDFAMLTTVSAEGTLHSRPMSTNGDVEFDGDLWFFTCQSSHKVEEIAANPRVNVSFAHPGKQEYLSMSGVAELVRDQAVIDRLWKPQHKVWFPKGKDDPEIMLLKVHVHQAEYWDSPSSPVAKLIALVKVATGSSPMDIGENRKLDLAA